MKTRNNSWWIGGIIGIPLGLIIVKEGTLNGIIVGAFDGIIVGWLIGLIIARARKKPNTQEGLGKSYDINTSNSTRIPNTNFYNPHHIMREKYKILIQDFLHNDVDPLWQYPNAKIKEMDSKSIIIESSYTFGIQHFKITDSFSEVIINWHVYLTVDPSVIKSNTGEITWRFPSNGDQNEMLGIIWRDLINIGSEKGFSAFL